MKLVQLIQENSVGDKTLQNIAAQIEKNCSDFLEMYCDSDGDSFLYRGVKNAGKAFVKPIRQNRKPIEMDLGHHEDLHQAFLDYGLTVTRANSIFTTAKMDVAMDWGEPYAVFVHDGWTGLAFDQNGTEDYSFYQLGDAAKDGTIPETLAELKPNEFNDTNTLQKYASKHYQEVLIKGSNYIGVHMSILRPLCKALNIPYNVEFNPYE